MSVLARSFAGGKRIYIRRSLLKLIVISCHVISIVYADSNSNSVQASPISPSGTVSTPAIPDLSPPKRSPHRQWRRHISPQAAPVLVLSPDHPPHYDPLITSGHPPTSSRLSKSSMKRSNLVPPSASLADIALTQSTPATVPTALAEPPLSHNVSSCCQPDMVLKQDSKDCHCVYPIKLDILLLNVSQNPDWKVFVQEFAKQLGLQVSQIELINFYVLGFTRLNISMDIIPQTGLSFSASDAFAITSSFALHQLHLNPALVGDFKLLNITWFKGPPSSEDCCQPDMVLKRDSEDCHCVYPIKLDLLLLNVSQNPDWKIFVPEFAKQLGLQVSQIELINFYVLSFTRLNISMDIIPQTGLSFSASDAYAINFSLSSHRVHLSPALVGDYELLNITWLKAPSPSEDCCQPDMVLKRDSEDCHCVYPIKLDLLLLNVSQNPDWKVFVQEFAKQLGLQPSQIELINFYMLSFTRFNISMDITPQTGLSFSDSDAYAINSSLSLHRVRLSPALVGDYELLNITWFETPTPSEAQKVSGDQQHRRWFWPVMLISIAIVVLLIFGLICYFQRRTLKSKGISVVRKGFSSRLKTMVGKVESLERATPNMQTFDYVTLRAATDDFSSENKLGQGGFGPVYKGKLPKGQYIAVKRLSKTSNQGLEEFKNEVMLTASLQHVNLIRLLGFCTDREELMLIYEYMPNKSLDLYLFDPIRTYLLDWVKRVHIIEGIIQGLLYLQEYSNFTIIHRDLKASNVLLDDEMNPKISDFGLARIFRKDDVEATTGRIVGTYGYVPPEYVRKGIYSMKYDVYSFGVLLLQIISGKKNSCCYGLNENLNLLGYAYELWKDDKCMEFIDPSMDDSSSSCKLMRCMQVALLCVQAKPGDRPSMLEVSSMLKNESSAVNSPKKPAFSINEAEDEDEDDKCLIKEAIHSVNDASISELCPR